MIISIFRVLWVFVFGLWKEERAQGDPKCLLNLCSYNRSIFVTPLWCSDLRYYGRSIGVDCF